MTVATIHPIATAPAPQASAAPAVLGYITSLCNAFFLFSSLVPFVFIAGLISWPIALITQLATPDPVVRSHVARARRSLGFHVLWTGLQTVGLIVLAIALFGASFYDINFLASAVQTYGVEVLLDEALWRDLPMLSDEESVGLLFGGTYIWLAAFVLAAFLNMIAGGVSLIRNILGIVKLGDRQPV